MRVFRTFGCNWTFNTGPFNIKEHTVITVKVPFEALLHLSLTYLTAHG